MVEREQRENCIFVLTDNTFQLLFVRNIVFKSRGLAPVGLVFFVLMIKRLNSFLGLNLK